MHTGLKKYLYFVLAMVIALSLSGASAEIYTAAEQGFGGEVTVSLTIENGKLVEVKALGDSETAGVGSRAIEMLPGMMVEANSVDVDSIAGATITSTAVRNAAKAALEQSGTTLEAARMEETKMIPGTYTAASTGFHAGLTVKVTVSEDSILAVEMGNNDETIGVGSLAFPTLISNLVDFQSMTDVVSGATRTSNGVYAAVMDCLTQAGANGATISRFMTTETPTAELPANNSADVVVIGAGASGTSAAAAAADAGASVILLEKTGLIGGSMRLSAGNMWAVGLGAKEPYASYGIQQYTTEEICEILNTEAAGGPVKKMDVLVTLSDRSEETMDWMIANGWEGRGIAYSHEKRAPRIAGSFARHCGMGFADTMQQIVESRPNIDIRMNSRAVALLTDENGAVCGVTVETKAGSYDISAKKVILASGGFTYNDEMMETYSPGYADGAMKIACIGDTGDGHRMALDLGAVMLGEGALKTHIAANDPFMVAVPVPFMLIVNTKGEQICANDDHYIETAMAVSAQEDHVGWCIYDSGFDTFVYNYELDDYAPGGLAYLEEAVKRGEAVKADTLEELAQRMGVNAETMIATVNAHNQHVMDSTTDEFGTNPAAMLPIMTAPFYAQTRTAGVMGTIPGVSVDETMKVLNAEDKPIENLYAVGEMMFGNVINKHYPMCGTAISLSITGGRIAAQDAVQNINAK